MQRGKLNLVKIFPFTHNANQFYGGCGGGDKDGAEEGGRRPLQWFPIHFKAKQKLKTKSNLSPRRTQDIFMHCMKKATALLQFKLMA